MSNEKQHTSPSRISLDMFGLTNNLIKLLKFRETIEEYFAEK